MLDESDNCKFPKTEKDLFIHMLSQEDFKKQLEGELSASYVEVNDTSGGCGQAFEVTVVSAAFIGKNKLMRHKAVNNALKSQIAAVHAFTQKTYTPEEWEKHQNS